MLSQEELKPYARLYDDIMSGAVDADNHRHDLGSHVAKDGERRENICQVMWPSLYLPLSLAESVLHRRVIQLAKELLGTVLEIKKKHFSFLVVGPDMEFDFDMLISKEAGSEVETPWHQDESYWLDLPDKVSSSSSEFYFLNFL